MGLKAALGLLMLVVGGRVSGFDRPVALVRLSDLTCGGYVYPKQIVWLAGGRAEERAVRDVFACEPVSARELPANVKRHVRR